jgi:hypothetical protein
MKYLRILNIDNKTCAADPNPDPSDPYVSGSVADPGCLSRIPDPDFCPSRIPDPKTTTKERVKKNLLSYNFCSHKYHKIKNYLYFELVKKKICANLQRMIELSPQNCH